jgi:transposase
MEVIIGAPERRPKFTPEFKDEAVKLVIETSRPIAEVAREIRVNEGTLGNWVGGTSTTTPRPCSSRCPSSRAAASSLGHHRTLSSTD